MDERETVVVFERNCYWEEPVSKEYPIIYKNELDLFPTRYLLKQKPNGLNGYDESAHIKFYSAWIIKREHGLDYNRVYAANVRDFKEVLNSRKHIPSKKESRILRQEKAKKNR